MTTELQHRYIDVNGVRLHIAEQGEGPLVMLLHCFPECWYSWRHQFEPLSRAGFRVVAPDQRGYGRSDQPDDVEAYSILHLVGDVVQLMGALGEDRAVVVGHDWGAPVAWTTSLLRPDLVRGVAGLSVPPTPRGSRPPSGSMRTRFGEGYYQLYFQTPGVAEEELSRDVRATIRRMMYGASGDRDAAGATLPVVRPGQGFLDLMPEPENLPGWLTEADLDAYTAEFSASGFTGPLNWYRNLDRNWELTAAWTGALPHVPALYVKGDRDLVPATPGAAQLIDALPKLLPDLRGIVTLPGCGHWTQQERPDEVTAALLDFLVQLD
ncbi:alpha/beta fold hydrolase [Streptomyces sp. NPDC007905]|uniref:alpha/beta fold hydrolase n=1 Tax=Streptomyces sp. NPDC007905 TaxID=3364788 RepID=UPI0036E1D864